MNQVNRRIVLSAIAFGAAMCAAPTVSNAEPTPAHEVHRFHCGTRNVVGRRVTFIARDGTRFQGVVVDAATLVRVSIGAGYELVMYSSRDRDYWVSRGGLTDDDPCHWPLGHVAWCRRSKSHADISATLLGARLAPEDVDVLGEDVAYAGRWHKPYMPQHDRLLMEEDRLSHK